jgi:hypothetical protein
MRRYGYTRDALFAFMTGLGFTAYALEGSRFVPFDDARNAKDAIWSRAPLGLNRGPALAAINPIRL